jgi:hypothetical protein
MARKSWHLSRRTFLRGTGVGLALPWLECMSSGATAAAVRELPKRLCSIYVPFGVSLPPPNHKHAKWNWFPTGKGREFEFTETLKSLEPHRKKLTVIGGLSHPNGRKMGGHDTGDIFLTGAYMRGSKMTNSISIDQLVAAKHGEQTRFRSLVLSSDGGVGEPTRAMTNSFSREGRPIPAMNKPAQIYARLFGVETDGGAQAAKRQLVNSANMLDRVLAHSKQVKRRLGRHDQSKFDEYLDSVRTIEQRVERAQAWLDIPKPTVDPKTLQLESSPAGPDEFLQTMFDLMALAFQSDSTRTATYMVGQVAGATTIANAFPAAIGLPGNWHGLAHGARKGDGPERLGTFDQFLVRHLTRFLDRLDAMPEGDGTVLDRTVILYGSSNSNTHQNVNYPLLLAGGGKLGLKHGQYLRYDKSTPMTNLLLTMLNRVGVPMKRFVDSTGELAEVIA